MKSIRHVVFSLAPFVVLLLVPPFSEWQRASAQKTPEDVELQLTTDGVRIVQLQKFFYAPYTVEPGDTLRVSQEVLWPSGQRRGPGCGARRACAPHAARRLDGVHRWPQRHSALCSSKGCEPKAGGGGVSCAAAEGRQATQLHVRWESVIQHVGSRQNGSDETRFVGVSSHPRQPARSDAGSGVFAAAAPRRASSKSGPGRCRRLEKESEIETTVSMAYTLRTPIVCGPSERHLPGRALSHTAKPVVSR